MKDTIRREITKAVDIFTAIRADDALLDKVAGFARTIVRALESGNKVLIAGNGGSAADAQHIAGEFVSRFNFDRPGLPAFALTTDTSVMTAIGNDYGYEKLFSRQVQAVGVKGDVFWGISTSGKSPNVLRAMEEARSNGLYVAGFTGEHGNAMRDLADVCIEVPSRETPKIQEGHILLGHIVCGLVESAVFSRS
ncbi:phosphoheptose isomerase [Burkholderia thailandensis MSMB121]|uniref:Phosphoheptose isomerase n=1 Tax=Burkholderia humptydooensis TaxID=430531 RepID=G3FNF7_9BURK|nr:MULTISPECIES: D-sedoheptulose 7-phosphate isomerase [Burkholderia]AGK48104.1 phosphoheptose isomerase [Burkholderia thailandensis MSMB121]ATF37614.1 SIS domain-containing protein [Burkholderia thailandensis]ADZ55342.1 putative phosphoheptose isomerase [Burkholderia humptydooensis]AEO78266.1 putative phosphoheptose isomerase [Burkholderia humptydooensis]KST75922.1 phosphoheptose isomerase [Burkholderia humptydooensis]